MIDRRISIAPMMDWTDRHERYFLRLIAPHVLLYTEMVTANAIIHGNRSHLLNYHPEEHPLALQLGGSEPGKLAVCAKLGEEWGYDEINLNVGCPSDRVQSGQFGVCLMRHPQLVAECVAAMKHVVKIPVTVKCRIGVDNDDSYEFLWNFIHSVAAAGCQIFIIHARKAWLNGLSPKENREVPPLCYDVVKRIKQDFPPLKIIINGGIKTLDDIQHHLQYVDGVMIGREAYVNPYFLTEIEDKIFANKNSLNTRLAVINEFIPYVQDQLRKNVKLSSMTRHILGLFQGQQGAKAWRRSLSENSHQDGAGIDVLYNALNKLLGEQHV